MPTFLHREVIFHTLIFAYTFSPKLALYNFPYCNSFKFDKYSHWPNRKFSSLPQEMHISAAKQNLRLMVLCQLLSLA